MDQEICENSQTSMDLDIVESSQYVAVVTHHSRICSTASLAKVQYDPYDKHNKNSMPFSR